MGPTDGLGGIRLAADVQVGPPHETEEENVKFSLTAEAGMNDGTAFPFTWLAIMLATGEIATKGWAGWLQYELFYKLAR